MRKIGAFLFVTIILLVGVSSCDLNKVPADDVYNDEIVLQRYDDSTKMITVRTEKKDTAHQLKTYYFQNGNIYMQGLMVEGKRHGEWAAYSEDGKLLTTGSYMLGIDHGLKTVYFENGKIRYQGNFEAGKKIGIWKFYKSDGSLAKELDMGTGKE